jgi:hypothetical protein
MSKFAKCPCCEWRGFGGFFVRHYREAHPDEMYQDAIRIDVDGFDSRPRLDTVE